MSRQKISRLFYQRLGGKNKVFVYYNAEGSRLCLATADNNESVDFRSCMSCDDTD